jgi:DNA-binding MarR family transcriptional regulator
MEKDRIDQLQREWKKQRPDLNTERLGVILRIQALARIFSDQAAEKLDEYQLQWWQYDVLSALRRQGRPFTLPATELAEANMLTSGAMTNRIDRLEETGLVERLEDPHDRRRVLVRLTPKGLDLIENAAEARFRSATRAIESLSENERIQLDQLLRKVLLAQEEAGAD